MKYDSIVVGAGFSGAVAARELAEAGKSVLVIDKRAQIGGNMYDAPDSNGVLVHWYGPHIFHTGSREVFDYLKQFSNWQPYEHRVLGRIDGKLVPIPFNFRSLDLLFPEAQAKAVKEKLAAAFPNQQKASVLDLMNAEDETIQSFGRYVFEKVFLHYTAKQWGTPPEQVDRSVINRVPVVLGYDDRYFQDDFQFMPENGFTPIFEAMLDHPSITVRLNCEAGEVLKLGGEQGGIFFEGEKFTGPVVFTGAIDQLFGYAFGPLPYRSLNLVFEQEPVTDFQPAAVVNYPNEEAFTRITEFKKLGGRQVRGSTTILKEYPMQYDPMGEKGNIPYYVISSPENIARYRQYAGLAESFPNLFLCGRLAEDNYYTMDAAVLRALPPSSTLLGRT